MTAFHWLSLFLILSATIFINAERSKRSPIMTNDLAEPNQFPWAVAIVKGKMAEYVCSGGIISEKYILSAAHCFIMETKDGLELISKKYTVYAGTINHRTALHERDSVTVSVARIFVPSDYSSISSRSDIAVAELTVALTTRRRNWQKLNLPVRDFVIGEQGVVAGFGVSRLSPVEGTRRWTFDNDGRLRYANINITLKGDSLPLSIYYNRRVLAQHFLGQMIKESDQIFGLCYGDSGDLLVQNSNTAVGVLLHIVDNKCNGTDVASIFINVYDHVPFIQRVMSGDHRNMHVKNCRP